MTATQAAPVTETGSLFPWWILLMQGIASLILGVLLVISPGMTTLIVVQFLGVYWLVSGMFSLIRIFTGDREIHWGWLLLSGILGIIAGFMVIQHPLWSAIIVPTVLVILLAIQGVVNGVIYFIEGLTQGPKVGPIILGAISLTFAIILFFSSLMAAVLLPTVVGTLAIIGGIAAIYMSVRMRQA